MTLSRPLVPFHAEPGLEDLQLACTARWEAGVLTLHYSLSGGLAPILLPASSPEPHRRDGLWQSTCFEAFIGQPGQRRYWELNLAPNGDWNLYVLSDYRKDLQPELAVRELPFSLHRRHSDPANPQTPDQFELALSLDMGGLLKADDPLELSATAVLEHRDIGCSYWAWLHSGPEADFHRRDSFLAL